MNGFRITLLDETFKVRFYHSPEKNTIACILETEWGEIYKGKARCNTREGDIYNETEGESIALKKALDHFSKSRGKEINRRMLKAISVLSKQDHGIYDAWKRRANKPKKQKTNTKWAIPDIFNFTQTSP